MTSKKITTVSAIGIHHAPYDRAGFTCKVVGFDEDTGPAAKAKIQPTVEKLLECFESLEGTMNRVSSFKVEWVHRHQQTPGYRAIYTLDFATDQVKSVVEISDKLTSIPGVQMKAPTYFFSDPEPHRVSALSRAFETARKRFETERALVGFDSNLTIISWNADYREHLGFSKVANHVSEGEDAGTARVEVHLDVSYGRR